jgi:hypothetical protein
MRRLLRPVGPLPAQVYWVRRAVLVVPVVLVVWLASWLLFDAQSGNAAGGGGDAAGEKRPTQAASPTTGSSPPEPAGGSAESDSDAVGSQTPKAKSSAPANPTRRPANVSPAGRSTKKPRKPAAAAKPAECEPGRLDVGVAAVVDGPIEAGARVPLTVIVDNDGSTSCRLEVRRTSFRVLVISGSDRIWDTAHCPSLVPARSVVIPPDESSSLALVWPGTRTREGCPAGQPRALPGYYAVEASVAGVVSPRDRFRLT